MICDARQLWKNIQIIVISKFHEHSCYRDVVIKVLYRTELQSAPEKWEKVHTTTRRLQWSKTLTHTCLPVTMMSSSHVSLLVAWFVQTWCLMHHLHGYSLSVHFVQLPINQTSLSGTCTGNARNLHKHQLFQYCNSFACYFSVSVGVLVILHVLHVHKYSNSYTVQTHCCAPQNSKYLYR